MIKPNPTEKLDLAQRVARPKTRIRLPPDVRVQQILDQALIEFSQRGFEAARMEDIAQRAGLSKGGLYAHFTSKDQLFEALLTRSLAPGDLKELDLPRPVAVRELVTWIVEQMYETLTHPQAVATMRLLIAEGSRVPQLVKVWGEQVIAPRLAMLSQLLSESSAGRTGRVSVIAREPWLVVSPAMHAVVSQLIAGDQQEVDLSQFKRGHVELLCELLEPPQANGAADETKVEYAPGAQ